MFGIPDNCNGSLQVLYDLISFNWAVLYLVLDFLVVKALWWKGNENVYN